MLRISIYSMLFLLKYSFSPVPTVRKERTEPQRGRVPPVPRPPAKSAIDNFVVAAFSTRVELWAADRGRQGEPGEPDSARIDGNVHAKNTKSGRTGPSGGADAPTVPRRAAR